eukprot:GFUD01093493.1.p1 GENE.GFUD01093493.1~~GFUD01093493.1.p1  ORF type:complete len:511 (+),score=129.28 GFUD01093493.1:81-1613(+)
MTVNGQAIQDVGVLNMAPLKRSASFTISVDKVEVGKAIKYAEPLKDIAENDEEEWSGDEGDDFVEEVIIKGADWESVNYIVKKFSCEDEVTGMDVSDRYIVAQYFLDPVIDVFDRKSQKLLHHLEGHEYGGQAVQILGQILYSGSKDCTFRTWDLKTGKALSKVSDHKDYIQSMKVKEVCITGLGEDGEVTAAVTGGAADHLINVYNTNEDGALTKRFTLEGHSGWVNNIDITNTMIISGSQDCTIKLWDLETGELFQSLKQDAEISCLRLFPMLEGYVIFGDGESKMSLLDLGSGRTIHLMPNTLVGTGRYRRSSKYHDKSVDTFHVSDNGYIITASSGSKFVKIWKIENYEEDVTKTDVTELQILRDHTDYLSVIGVQKDTIFSTSGDGTIYLHRFPEGKQHYDMLRTQERNSVAVLYQGPQIGFAPTVEKPTVLCEGKLCKAGKSGLAKSSSSFEVCFALKPLSRSLTEGKLIVPQTILEDSEDDSDCEFVIEYVTDDEEDESDYDM